MQFFIKIKKAASIPQILMLSFVSFISIQHDLNDVCLPFLKPNAVSDSCGKASSSTTGKAKEQWAKETPELAVTQTQTNRLISPSPHQQR